MRAIALLLLCAGCPRPLDDDHACTEIGTAIGARTQDCTGDAELGEARIEAFEAQAVCLINDTGGTQGVLGDDAYACALILRNLACELVERDGDDLDAWLAHATSCRLAVELP